MDGGPVIADAAFRLGASVVYGTLNQTPRDITDLLEPHLVDNVLSVHARIVSERTAIFIDNAIRATISDLEVEKSDDEDAAVQLIAKRPNKDLAARLNQAVDGNVKLMAGLAANLTVGRLIAYGFLKAARQEGIKNYTLWNPRDERTSAICMELTNPPGHIFKVAFGLAHVENLLRETDPEKLKALAPFLTTGDAHRIRDGHLTAWQLEEANILVPPFHPWCRTLIVKVGDKLDVDMPHGPIAIASPIELPVDDPKPSESPPPGWNWMPYAKPNGAIGWRLEGKPPPPINVRVAPGTFDQFLSNPTQTGFGGKPTFPRTPTWAKPTPVAPVQPAIALPPQAVESVLNPGQLRLPLGGVEPGTSVLKPFIDFQAEVAGIKNMNTLLQGSDFTPLGKIGSATGINRGAGRLDYNGRQYFVKPVTDSASNLQAEVAAAEIGELLGVASQPTAVSGKNIVMPFLEMPKVGDAADDAVRAAQAMTPYQKTRWLFGEYIVGDTDKHRNNYVVDVPNNRLFSIDGGRAFNHNSDSVFMNLAFNSKVDPHYISADGVWDKNFKLDVSAIRYNLAQKEAVTNVIKGLGLEHYYPGFAGGEALEGVLDRFEAIEGFLKQHPEPTFGQWQRFIGGY
jgi:hypothetical protein